MKIQNNEQQTKLSLGSRVSWESLDLSGSLVSGSQVSWGSRGSRGGLSGLISSDPLWPPFRESQMKRDPFDPLKTLLTPMRPETQRLETQRGRDPPTRPETHKLHFVCRSLFCIFMVMIMTYIWLGSHTTGRKNRFVSITFSSRDTRT